MSQLISLQEDDRIYEGLEVTEVKQSLGGSRSQVSEL